MARREEGRKKFQYRAPDPEDVKQRANRNLSNYDGIVNGRFPSFKPKDGFNVVRVLPNDADACPELSHWAMEVYVHSEIGPDHGKFLCLEKMRNEPCPICEARRDLDRRGRASKEDLDALKPYARFILWLVDRNDERAGPKWWEISPGFERDMCNLSLDKRRGGVLSLDDPDGGYDFEFDRKGTGLTTKYNGKALSRESTYLHDKQSLQDEWLEFIGENPLPSILVWRDYEYIKSIFSGRGASEGDDDHGDDDDRPRRSRLRDEEDGDADERDSRRSRERTRDGGRGGDEEEPPRRRSRRDEDDERSSRRSVRDEDDEDERPRERERERTRSRDEDDEPPRSRRGRDEDDEPRSRRPREDEGERRRPSRDDDDEPPRSRREPDPEPEPEEAEQGDDDLPPFEEETPQRRSRQPEPEPEPDEPKSTSDVDAAREKLRRMAEQANKKS